MREKSSPERLTYPEQNIVVQRYTVSLENGFRFAVKVTNESLHSIGNIKVWLISYPSNGIRLTGPGEVPIARMDGGQIREATFQLEPTTDCVNGEIVAAVAYSDANGAAHTVAAEAFPIKAVCSLSLPETINAPTFERELAGMENGEITINLDNLSAQQMYEKAIAALPELRFHPVSSSLRKAEGLIIGEINGWSRGRSTRRKLGLSLIVYGPDQGIGCSCRIVVSAEDDTIILPSIDEVRRALGV
jgi:hypothetical protein